MAASAFLESLMRTAKTGYLFKSQVYVQQILWSVNCEITSVPSYLLCLSGIQAVSNFLTCTFGILAYSQRTFGKYLLVTNPFELIHNTSEMRICWLVLPG